MRLNDAVIENQVFDDVECASMQEFIDKLLNAKDLVADVYVNTHRVCSGRLSLAVNNNWIIGCVDERLSLAGSNTIENIAIRVHQTCDDLAEATYILTSYTIMNQIMEGNDVDADLYFKIVSTVPNCTTKCFVPDSVFRSLGTSKMEPVVLDELPIDPTVAPTFEATYSVKGVQFMIHIEGFDESYNEKSFTWLIKVNEAPYGNKLSSEGPNINEENEEIASALEGAEDGTVFVTVRVNEEEEYADIPASKEV